MITICMTYFRSLTLSNLDAALFSVRQQDLTHVQELVLVDNNTEDSERAIEDVIEEHNFPIPVRLLSFKHGDPTLTHAWSTNTAVCEAETPWVFFTRADYLLSFDALYCFVEYAEGNRFISSRGCHLFEDIAECEKTDWRTAGPHFSGNVFDYTLIDAGVWMARTEAFDKIEGLNEGLTAWGHAQTDFQYRLFKSGVEFKKIPRTLFWHPLHAAERDIELANRQLAAQGIDLKEMWDRYEGVNPYR